MYHLHCNAYRAIYMFICIYMNIYICIYMFTDDFDNNFFYQMLVPCAAWLLWNFTIMKCNQKCADNSYVSITICERHSYIGLTLCARRSYIGLTLCARHSYIGLTLSTQHSYIGLTLCARHSYIGLTLCAWHSYIDLTFLQDFFSFLTVWRFFYSMNTIIGM